MRTVHYEIELLTTPGQQLGAAIKEHADLLKQAGFTESNLLLARFFDQDPNRIIGYPGTPEIFKWSVQGQPENLTYLRLIALVARVKKRK